MQTLILLYVYYRTLAITNDKDGNTLAEKGLRYEARYEYNGQNRMAYSEVMSHAGKTRTVTMYEYDTLGRRALTQNVTGQAMRTVYDGRGFEVIREGETFRDGSLTTRFATGGITTNGATGQSDRPTGERYRWVSDGGNGRATADDGYSAQGGCSPAPRGRRRKKSDTNEEQTFSTWSIGKSERRAQSDIEAQPWLILNP